MPLRPYQESGIKRITQAWREGHKAIIAVAPVGAGKTALAIEMTARAFRHDASISDPEKQFDVFFIAHRQELISQPYQRYTKEGMRAGIIKAGHKPNPSARLQIVSVQTVVNRVILPTIRKRALVFVDECFPAGTLIDGKPIENIKKGDKIKSFDGVRVILSNVTDVFKSKPNTLLTIHTRLGNKITCTWQHPIYTNRGYLPAVELNVGEKLYGIQDLSSLSDLVSAGISCKAVLLRRMQGCFPSVQTQSYSINLRPVWCTSNAAGQETLPSDKWSGILLSCVFKRISRASGSNIHDCDESQVRQCTDDCQQSYAQTGDPRESQSCAPQYEPSSDHSGWQRQSISKTTSNPIDRTWQSVGLGICGMYKTAIPIPALLQDRHCTSREETGYRGGWGIAPHTKSSGARSEKGQLSPVDWVDRIEIHKQTSDGTFNGLCSDGHVYNVEVETSHSYFANGFLVHNCHRVKSASYTQVIENLKKTYVEVFLIGLTATPYRGDHQGLGDVATKLIEIATPKQLVSEGWICNPISYVGENDAPLDVTLPTSHGEFNTDASAALSDRPHLVANIVDMWRKYSGGYPGWGFAVNVAHSQHIVERFNAAGIRAAHLDGSTPPRERKRILARSSIGGFASNHPDGLDVVCNVDVLTEGTDPDSCYEILLEDPEVRDLWQGKSYPPEQNPIAVIGDWARTKSMGKYIQRIGRACRTHPKKTHAVYLDHAGNEARHCQLLQHEGFTLDDGSNVIKTRLVKKATKAAVLNCPVCGMAFKPPLANCADCGSALGVVGNVDLEALAEAPGELVPSVAQPNLPRKQLPHEQEAWLRARLVWWESDNAGRVARGLPAYKRGHFYHTANAAFLAKFKRPMDVGVFEKVMGR